jgi:hypothetical protein
MLLLFSSILLLLLSHEYLTETFYGTPPSVSDYDAYGVKFAANDFLVVVASNDFAWSRQLGIMFYNQVLPLSQEYVYCDQFYPDDMYIFSIKVSHYL